MSQEDVELVRAAYEAWNDRDMDAALSFADPNIEVVQDSQIPGATTAKGRDEFRAWLEGFYDTWERFELTVGDVRQVGDRIVVLAQVRALGKTTGVPVEARIAHVLTVRDQQAVRWESYTRPDEALEAVGLSEQAMSQENADLIRRFFEAAEREDWVEIEGLFDSDCEIQDFDMPDADGYRGHEGFFEWIAAWDDAWDSWEMTDLEIHSGPSGKLIALFTIDAKGRGSGIELRRRDAMVYAMRGGRIARLEYYNEQQRQLALEAVGLRE